MLLKIATTTYNMRMCVAFYPYIFLISPNLAKYTYRLLPLEEDNKIEQ